MADPLELDDYEFDEDGIYREKDQESGGSGDQGILVDEDGIWRDEGDDGHFSFRTFQTDSGVGGERKSSTHSIQRLPGGLESPQFLDDRDDSYPLDEKSINISELEASESGQGEEYSPFEGHSIGSGEGLDLPELNDESYMNFTSGQSSDRKDSKATSILTEDPFEGREIREEDELMDSEDNISDIEGEDHIQYRRQKPPKPHENFHSSIDYLIGSSSQQSNTSKTRETPHSDFQDEVEFADELQEVPGDLPESRMMHLPITGDSIFTQEEGLVDLSQLGNKHSLAEFEQLEAALEDGKEQQDLIGAYLQDLEEQDEYERSQGSSSRHRSQDNAHSRSRSYSRSDSESEDEDMMRETAKSGSDQYGSSIPFEEQLITNQQPPFGDSLGMSTLDTIMSPPGRDHRNSSLHRPPTPTQIPRLQNRTPIHSRPGSTLSWQDGPSRSLSRQDSPSRSTSRQDSPSRSTSRQDSPSRSRQDSLSRSISWQDSGSLSQRSLSRPESPDRNSRIPMLRSRSPSMSRPGSSLSNNTGGSRNASPGLLRSSSPNMRRQFRPRRALPLTPVIGQQSPDTNRSRSGSLEVRDILEEDEEEGRPRSFSSPETRRRSPSPPPIITKPTKTTKPPPAAQSSTSSVSFKIRTGSSYSSKPQPVKPSHPPVLQAGLSQDSDATTSATTPRHELKQKFILEKEQRMINEETLDTLQVEYNTLLKKYAEAENTIDELRLGAKVTLYSDSPVPGQAVPGTIQQQAQHGNVINIATRGAGTAGNMQQAQKAVMHGSRPGSRASSIGLKPLSITSAAAMGTSIAASPVTTPGSERTTTGTYGMGGDDDDELLNMSLASDGVKLSLLAKAKAVEDQTCAFCVLLDEEHLSLGDQEKALHNIKHGLEALQQDYRDAKAEQDYMRRQGDTFAAGFDEDKGVDGEIYKLSMTIDDLEHRVQENLKDKTLRVPFQGNPLKADHGVGRRGSGRENGLPPREGLSPRRQPSLGSITGGADIDEQLHQLSKDYSSLMDRYRRLKQLPHTPDTDAEVNRLLTVLKDIYEQTPDHRKPPLPPELENQYSVVHGSFVTPEMLDEDALADNIVDQVFAKDEQGPHYHRRMSGDIMSSGPESDVSSRHSRGSWRAKEPRYRDDPTSTSQGEESSGSRSSSRRRRGMPQVPTRQGSRDSRAGGDSATLSRKLPHAGRHRDVGDKDSGYVGSEKSGQRGQTPTRRGIPGVSHGYGTSPRTLPSTTSRSNREGVGGIGVGGGGGVGVGQDSEDNASSTGSADSVIERRGAARSKVKDGARSGVKDGSSGGGGGRSVSETTSRRQRPALTDRTNAQVGRSRSQGHVVGGSGGSESDSVDGGLHTAQTRHTRPRGENVYEMTPADPAHAQMGQQPGLDARSHTQGPPPFQPLPMNVQHLSAGRSNQQYTNPPPDGAVRLDAYGRQIVAHNAPYNPQHPQQHPNANLPNTMPSQDMVMNHNALVSHQQQQPQAVGGGRGQNHNAPVNNYRAANPTRNGYRLDENQQPYSEGPYGQSYSSEHPFASYQEDDRNNPQQYMREHRAREINGHPRQNFDNSRQYSGESYRDASYNSRERDQRQNGYHPENQYRDWSRDEDEMSYGSRSGDPSYDSRYNVDNSFDAAAVAPGLPTDQYRRDYIAQTEDGTYASDGGRRRRKSRGRKSKYEGEGGDYYDYDDGDYFEPEHRDSSRSRGKSKGRSNGRSDGRDKSKERYSKLREYYVPTNRTRAEVRNDRNNGYRTGRLEDENNGNVNKNGYNEYNGQRNNSYAGRPNESFVAVGGNNSFGARVPSYGAANGYPGAPVSGYVAAPVNGYTAAPANGYTDGNTSGYVAAPANGYTAAPVNGYTAAPANGYTAAPANGYTVGNTNGYVAAPANGYVAAPVNGYSTAPAPDVPASSVGFQVQSQPCPMCGGAGSHTHGEYTYNPHTAVGAGQVQQQVPVQANGSPMYVLQAEGGDKKSKVRYYVREYEEGPKSILRRSSPKKSKRYVMEESGSDSELRDGDDLNLSLNSALKTAYRLKKLSKHMKSTINEQIVRR